MKLSYRPHCKKEPTGHLYIEDAPHNSPCTVKLVPAASADQKWLDEFATELVRRVNKAEPKAKA